MKAGNNSILTLTAAAMCVDTSALWHLHAQLACLCVHLAKAACRQYLSCCKPCHPMHTPGCPLLTAVRSRSDILSYTDTISSLSASTLQELSGATLQKQDTK